MPVANFSPQSGAGGSNVTTDEVISRTGVDQTLANIVAGAGTGIDSSSNVLYIEIDGSSTSNQYAQLWRSIMTFNTASLTSGAVITGAKLKIYIVNNADGFGSLTFNVVGATPSANNNIVAADFSQLGTTKFSADTSITQSTSAYLEITLNASGIAYINKIGVTGLGVRLTCDGMGGAITWGSTKQSYMGFQSADLANPPILEVTYINPFLSEIIIT